MQEKTCNFSKKRDILSTWTQTLILFRNVVRAFLSYQKNSGILSLSFLCGCCALSQCLSWDDEDDSSLGERRFFNLFVPPSPGRRGCLVPPSPTGENVGTYCLSLHRNVTGGNIRLERLCLT